LEGGRTVEATFAAAVGAAGYGTANFCGGMASRRQPPLLTLLISQAAALPVVLAAAAVATGRVGTEMVWGALAGLIAFAGAVAAYACFSLQRPLGVAAALLATTTALVPVASGLLLGQRPGLLAAVGAVLAVVAVSVLAWPQHATTDMRAAVLAAAGGALFGGYHVVMATRTTAAGGLWPVLASQAVIVVLALAAVTVTRIGRSDRRRAPDRAAWSLSACDGIASTTATIAALAAVHSAALIPVGAVLGLAPAVTAVLARFGGDHLPRRRLAGLALAVAAIACLSSA
jgi:drug/metabolite transporter (DMT)-like permease